jgi:hypothetical protein
MIDYSTVRLQCVRSGLFPCLYLQRDHGSVALRGTLRNETKDKNTTQVLDKSIPRYWNKQYSGTTFWDFKILVWRSLSAANKSFLPLHKLKRKKQKKLPNQYYGTEQPGTVVLTATRLLEPTYSTNEIYEQDSVRLNESKRELVAQVALLEDGRLFI